MPVRFETRGSQQNDRALRQAGVLKAAAGERHAREAGARPPPPCLARVPRALPRRGIRPTGRRGLSMSARIMGRQSTRMPPSIGTSARGGSGAGSAASAAASIAMPASPSKVASGHRLSSAAAASNKRPALEVCGVFKPRSIMRASTARSPRSKAATGASSAISKARAPYSACSTPSAERRGSRTAASPPGRANGQRCANRAWSRCSTRRNSPPQTVPSPPQPVPSQAMPRSGADRPLSAMHALTCAR